jgi:isopenicillin N synthase-like dioxygenase
MASSSYQIADAVELDYADLLAGRDLGEEIERAFGASGAGLLTVKNVPGFVEARRILLPLARKFALLPDDVKDKYVHAESYYAFGWSHGKENLEGKPDLSKGSFYANPQYDFPVEDEAIVAQYPSFVHPNIWPNRELPEFAPAFKHLGQIIVSVGELIAKQCDAFVHSRCPSYPVDKLYSIIRDSKCCKARLLHYFPVAPDAIQSKQDFSSWCGWHNDHGSLTGLTSALFLNESGEIVQANTDPEAGLYARSRHSDLLKILIPENNIAFQIGETAQVHSGGYLQATPHAVRSSAVSGVSRETFAVFMEPMWAEPMAAPHGVDPTQTQTQSAAANLPKGVPPLAKRWIPVAAHEDKVPQTFGEFSEVTHKSYY